MVSRSDQRYNLTYSTNNFSEVIALFNKKNFGKRIASLRKENGYTQEQLAEILHVTGQAVSKWEKGNALPDTSFLPLLAGVLKTSIDRLLTGEEIAGKTSPYDQEYIKEEYYWGLKHSMLAEMTVNLCDKLKYGSRLLDIGSGEGRDSIYFAKCGFVVDALEISLPGIEKIKQYSNSESLPIHALHTNMIDYEMDHYYDVIYSMGALQFLPIGKRQQHFESYKKHTSIGGLNAHLVFVEKPFIPTAPDWQKNEFFYRSGDLAGYYYDWQIIYCEEQIVDCKSGNSPHQHAISSIIAKKI